MNPWRFGLLLLAMLMAPARVAACNIPVFRYALERWRTDREEDRYQAIVFHRGPLAAEDQKTIAALETPSKGRDAPANLTVETVDLAGQVPESLRKLWEQQGDVKVPWMVLRYPEREEERKTIWSRPLRADTVRVVRDSPARRDIARRLLKGDSIVWVLLECGNQEKDDAAAAVLQKEMQRLAKTLQLPDPAGDNSVKLLSSLPLQLAFSTIHVKRTDPAEAVLVEMLLHTDPDLGRSTEPMVFPVFGRGRALDGLIGKGINADTIQDAARFLCGACSCEVKRLNPGVDLLVAADWDSVIDAPEAAQPSPPSPKGERVPIPTPRLRTDVGGVAPKHAATSRVGLLSGIAVAALGVLAAGALVRRVRARKHEGGGA